MNARPGWHPADILSAIKKRGMGLTRLAIEAGASPEACRSALIRRNRRGEEIISAFLLVPACDLWPDRWEADGSRKKVPRRKRVTKSIRVAPDVKANDRRTRRGRAREGSPESLRRGVAGGGA